MSVVVFASGGGGNLQAAIDLSNELPELISIDFLVADRLHIRALEIAKNNGIPFFASSFENFCGKWSDCRQNEKLKESYRSKSIQFHDIVLQKLIEFEKSRARPFDLAVLSYRRIIQGQLLKYFKDRMINQHPADLAVFDPMTNRRLYAGINGLFSALAAGEKKTRTSTILVNEGEDAGEILCQGPWVHFTGNKISKERVFEHENIQKEKSDWPSLKFALKNIAEGRYGVSSSPKYPDKSREIFLNGKPLGYAGKSLE